MNKPNPLPCYWRPEYVLGGGVETRTKSGPIATLLAAGEVNNVELRQPAAITRDELLVIHDAKYLDNLLAEDPALVGSILASTGGVRDGLDAALATGAACSLSSGLHHAKRGQEYGYCYINGLALAALRALAAPHSLGSVGIFDTDAHWGGGTYSLVGENEKIRIADITVSDFDSWSSNEERHFLNLVRTSNEYLEAVEAGLAHLRGVDVLIYNAGMDPFEGCGVGGLSGITLEVLTKREQMVAQWCSETSTPVLFVLAGGYTGPKLDLDGVARLHLITIKAFAEALCTPAKPANTRLP